MEKTFGQWIKQRRKELDLTQNELADEVVCSLALIRKLESDDRRPSKLIAERLANVLDIPAPERALFIALARQIDVQSSPYPLPLQTTFFIGRNTEIQQIEEDLANPNCRLLSLVGLGGIGKTQLAIEVATRCYRNGQFHDGVCFVGLAPLASGSSLTPTIAEALQLQLLGSEAPLDQVLSHLHTKELLLVLDNFEDHLAERQLISAIIQHAPYVKLLITSRERLNVSAEWVLEIHGLGFPTSANREQDDAVQLFLRHAKQMNVNLTATDYPYVVEICRLTDGMPLGIELAARWTYLFSCKEIMQKIRANLEFLTGDMPEHSHQRSLGHVFNHSWELLTPDLQQVLKRLAVLRGDFRQETAYTVAGATLAQLSELRNKSLIYHDGKEHFHLHELLRQYCVQHLSPDEQQATLYAYAHYYSVFMVEKARPLFTQMHHENITHLVEEIEHIRWAWRWAAEQSLLDFIDNMADGLWIFYYVRGWLHDARASFDYASKALKAVHQESTPTALYVRVLQSWFDFHSGQVNIAQATCFEALSHFEALGITEGRALTHCHLSLVFYFQALGKDTEAKKHAKLALHLAEESNDTFYISNALFCLGRLSYRLKEYSEKSLRRVLNVTRTVQNAWGYGYIMEALTQMELAAESHETVREFFEKNLQLALYSDDQWGTTLILMSLGRLAALRGDADESLRYFRKSLENAYKFRLIPLVLGIIIEIALLNVEWGDSQQGIEWLIFALNHPATWQESRTQAQNALTALQQHYPQLAWDTNYAPKTSDLENVLQAIFTLSN